MSNSNKDCFEDNYYKILDDNILNNEFPKVTIFDNLMENNVKNDINNNKTLKINGKNFKVLYASNFVDRALGLMFRDINYDEALVFKYIFRKIHVHTCFMKYPIYIIFLNDDKVVDFTYLKPWSTYQSKEYSNMMVEFKDASLKN
ncbi:DUF192 domain-containing protein [Methanococcus voltae]|uniref:DUF192 domain-containing protein n=1 Tax=Methanococcus voltae (strain ATCC BAA-1334 / A3) TaxID=456320 RepID=D7DVA6_METV3|nr:DUF192 domain-containing protein [Methanococcus voltae]MCS3901700.1 uncharacterized membrane protein (UPF0127 family) [Methanococcus voltae]